MFDLEQRLGPEYAGKVMLATSHSHSAWAQFTGHGPLKLGAGAAARARLQALPRGVRGRGARCARRARRRRSSACSTTAALRSDGPDQPRSPRRERRAPRRRPRRGPPLPDPRRRASTGAPIAIVPIFGEHPTLNGEDNPFATDRRDRRARARARGAVRHAVVVMHLQSAGGDTSAVGHGGVDCNNQPGKPSDPCFAWAAEEGHGRARDHRADGRVDAAPARRCATRSSSRWSRARSRPARIRETFTIRDGALALRAVRSARAMPDGVVYDGGAARVADRRVQRAGRRRAVRDRAADVPGRRDPRHRGHPAVRLVPASSISPATILGPIFDIDFGVDETPPGVRDDAHHDLGAAHRRLRDRHAARRGHVPARRPRAREVAGRPDKTIVVGYAQGHVGYMLRPEDWVLGGYEPSVTFWGPLEAEYIAEQLRRADAARDDADARGRRRRAAPRASRRADDDRRPRDRRPGADGGHRPGDRAGGDVGAHRHAGAGAARGADPARRRHRDVRVDRRRPAGHARRA